MNYFTFVLTGKPSFCTGFMLGSSVFCSDSLSSLNVNQSIHSPLIWSRLLFRSWMCRRQLRLKRISSLVSTSRFTTLYRVLRAFTSCFLWGTGADTLQMTPSGWGETTKPARSHWSTRGCPANIWPSTHTEHQAARTCCSPSRTWAGGGSCMWTARRWTTWKGWTSRTRSWSGSESTKCWSSASLARRRGASRLTLRCWQCLRPERHACVCLVWHQSWTQAHVRWVSQLNSEQLPPWRMMRPSCVIHDEPLLLPDVVTFYFSYICCCKQQFKHA